MTIKYSAMVDLWGAGQLVHFPLDRFGSTIRFSRDLLPPGGSMPSDVPILFTTYLTGDIQLFNIVEIQIGEREPVQLVVLGAAPDSPDLLFCLDTESGVVTLMDPSGPGMELVNSSFALFVEFLYRIARLIHADRGGQARATQAHQLRAELHATDPAAFEGPESWWSIAFAHLMSVE